MSRGKKKLQMCSYWFCSIWCTPDDQHSMPRTSTQSCEYLQISICDYLPQPFFEQPGEKKKIYYNTSPHRRIIVHLKDFSNRVKASCNVCLDPWRILAKGMSQSFYSDTKKCWKMSPFKNVCQWLQSNFEKMSFSNVLLYPWYMHTHAPTHSNYSKTK